MILTTRAKVVSSIFIIGFTTYLLYVSYQAEFRLGMSQLINVTSRTGKSTNLEMIYSIRYSSHELCRQSLN